MVVLTGCVHNRGVAVDGAVLGRVVIYRNGVAFYEKRAIVEDGRVAVHVPRERIDDFLKSLTVIDPTTNRPLSVTVPRNQGPDGYLTMTLDSGDARRSEVMLTYVTEAAAWKPSYRVVVGRPGKVMLEAWAIVDNVSGEDWNRVQVGVGASSALSFRYDMWSVRRIDRDLLQNEDRFAVAPPTGVSPYPAEEEIVALDGNSLQSLPGQAGQTGAAGGMQLTDEELAKLAEQEAKEEVIVVSGSQIERRQLTTQGRVYSRGAVHDVVARARLGDRARRAGRRQAHRLRHRLEVRRPSPGRHRHRDVGVDHAIRADDDAHGSVSTARAPSRQLHDGVVLLRRRHGPAAQRARRLQRQRGDCR